MTTSKPYYDHDSIWQQRDAQGNPVWGSYSHRVYSQVLERIAKLSQPVQKLLDVGCGAGAFGERVESLGIKYTGVDASEAAINLGRKHFPGLNLAIVDFAKSPLVPQVADAKFEIVTCINVLHCLTMDADRANLLHNLRQVTMNKGYLILTTMIGPVPLEHQDRRSPRAYRGEDEILVEFAESGWRRLDYELEPPRREFLAGNLTFVGQPCI